MSTVKTDNLSTVDGTKSIPTSRVAQGVAAAWVNFNGTGTVAIRASYNVSSITDNGTGDYTINLTTALADADYVVTGFAMPVGGAGASYSFGSGTSGATSQTTTAYRLGIRSISDAVADVSQIYAALFR
jgi:hypothetical protein